MKRECEEFLKKYQHDLSSMSSFRQMNMVLGQPELIRCLEELQRLGYFPFSHYPVFYNLTGDLLYDFNKQRSVCSMEIVG